MNMVQLQASNSMPPQVGWGVDEAKWFVSDLFTRAAGDVEKFRRTVEAIGWSARVLNLLTRTEDWNSLTVPLLGKNNRTS